jgi:hypothetical protein
MGKRRLWKSYFFLMTALMISVYILPFFPSTDPGGWEFEELVLLPLYVAQLVGLFGFAYWRAIGTRRIWQMIFGATVLETGWMLYGLISIEPPPAELGSLFIVWLAVTIVPLLALQFWALFSYAFRVLDLWARAT